MKLFIKSIFAFLLFTFTSVASVKASHVPGGNVTYQCVGPNQFLITLTLFEDCAWAFEGSGNQFLTATNTCGLPNPQISLANTIYQQEVSQLCPNQAGQSSCQNGNLPGVWMHQWQAVITLPGPCDTWTFAYSSCCRNTTTNLVGQPGYYWATTLNSQTAPCNSSAQITSPPIPYVCINQPVSFNMGALDPDGNTLQYQFVNALTNATTSVNYQGGYSGAVPIPGATINPNTGQINFTPTQTGNFVFAVLITEYDANGNVTGTVTQDFQFIVINCTNQVPSPPVGGITNFTGQGSVTGPNSVQVCEGDSFCFDLVFQDPDPNDILTVTSNIAQTFPTATLTIVGTNPVTATVCGTVQPGAPAASVISFEVEDNACPIPGIGSFPILMNVITSTYAGANVIMCETVGTQLNASGGTTFNWSVISGDPIVVGGNFSCNPCQSPVANPSITTVYEVVSNLSGGCVNIDTVTVTVVPNFTFNVTQSSPTSCLQEPINLNVTTNPQGAFTYAWTPPGNLSNPNIPNPVANHTAPGTYTYDVQITSPDGCVKNGSLTIGVIGAYAPDITALISADTVLCGDLVQLDVDLGGGIPAQCGPSLTGTCVGQINTSTIGNQTGQNTTTTWPAPYGHWFRNARHQFLFTAAELNAMGFVGGKISEVGWQITQINGLTNYPGYTIRMGCTNLTNLTGTFQTGLTTVYGPQNYNIVLGWNMHNLTTAYEWDGVSNLIVEICYALNTGMNWTQNSITPWTTTPFVSTVYYFSDGVQACPQPTGTTSTNRPITRFVNCPTVPDPNNYSYQWTAIPANGSTIASPTTKVTDAEPIMPTTYQIVVTDINGGCTDTATVSVYVDCYPLPDGVNPLCFGGSDGYAWVSNSGINAPYTITWTDAGGNVLQTSTNVAANDTIYNLTAGTYFINVSGAGGYSEDTLITLGQPTPVLIQTLADTTICIGGTATLFANASGGIPGYTYEWFNVGLGQTQTIAPNADGCYEVYALDANNCFSDTLEMCVNLNPPIVANTSGNQSVCPGNPAQISAFATGGSGVGYTYTWINSTGQVVGNTDAISVIPAFNGEEFCVIVLDDCETPGDTACLQVFYHEDPIVDIQASILSGCFPLEVRFDNLTDLTQIASCNWVFGDGATANNSCSTVSHTYTTPGVYSVTLNQTTVNGCPLDTTYTALIMVYDYPNANFIATPQPAYISNPNVAFTNTSSNGAVSYEWFFGEDGVLGTSTATNPVFGFPDIDAGIYPVTLVVTSANGCSDTITQLIIINGIYTFYIPNAFTPNGDGINDTFFPKGEYLSQEGYKMIIFDRWGHVVFETEKITEGWDGRVRGQIPAKTDVFVWKIEAYDIIDGHLHEYKGHVTLVR
ncbi:MAG: PKD domain-containing protein [Flavobacteriales bacterium]